MKSLFLLVLAVCLSQSNVLAQATHSTVVDQQLAGVANLPSHQISPNDLLALSVYDAPELTRTLRVGPDGRIDIPLLKEHIQTDGLIPTELEGVIASSLKSEGILVRPLVSVTIMAYNSRNVSVMGSVHKPLSFELIGNTRLMDALAKAEGLTQDAGPDVLVSAPGETGVRHINVKELMSGTNTSLNVSLEGGEEIRIPEARKVYVVGNVKKPGAIPLHDGSESSVLKLLALTEGVTPYAQPIAWIYRSDPQGGPRQEISIQFKKILDRKSPDVTLAADDILYIPDNLNKRAAVETGKILLGTVSGIVTAFIYTH